MGTYDDSKINVARKYHKCCVCLGGIGKGAEQLAYKPGLRSTLHLHIECALQKLGSWRCRALEEEAQRRIIAGETCKAPCVGYRCCLPAGHPPRLHHQWVPVQPTSQQTGNHHG